jgi:hypothetical protein
MARELGNVGVRKYTVLDQAAARGAKRESAAITPIGLRITQQSNQRQVYEIGALAA